MKSVVFILLMFLCFQCFADEPTPVKVYCFSDALKAGFKDIDGSFFCNRLTKIVGKKKGSIEPAPENGADVIIHHLGMEQLEQSGKAIYLSYGLLWSPTETVNYEAAILKVGDFAKEFRSSGINASSGIILVKQVESWIRENRETILKKTKQK